MGAQESIPEQALCATGTVLNGEIEAAAEDEGITVVCVPEHQLTDIIGEAQKEIEKPFRRLDVEVEVKRV